VYTYPVTSAQSEISSASGFTHIASPPPQECLVVLAWYSYYAGSRDSSPAGAWFSPWRQGMAL